jgi:hypothetical protein
MRRIGVRLIHSNIGADGLERGHLSDRDFIAKKYQADRIIDEILDTSPPGGPID